MINLGIIGQLASPSILPITTPIHEGSSYLINEGFESGVQPSGWVVESGLDAPDWAYTPALVENFSLNLHGNTSTPNSAVGVSFASNSTVEAFCLYKLSVFTAETLYPMSLWDTSGRTRPGMVMVINTDGTVWFGCADVVSSTSILPLSSNTLYYIWARYVKAGGIAGGDLVTLEWSTNGIRVGSGANFLSITNGNCGVNQSYIDFSGGGSNADAIFDHILVSTGTIPSNP